jgi:chemotaxis signal transduction protein
VDRVVGVVRIDPAAMTEPPATIEAACDRYTRRLLMDPSASDGSRRIALLDGERLLAGLARSLA